MSRNLTVATALFLAAVGTVAHAAEVNDAGSAANAKISLSAAVAAAEQHVKGKVVRAEFEQQKGGGWAYDIEVAAGAKVFDVKIDGDKGTVIASTEDNADNDDNKDEID
jgi:uncharacterized membrane protein YkoI